MTEQDQVRALAELDEPGKPWRIHEGQFVCVGQGDTFEKAKDYLHSYDAIIPAIQKQNDKIIAMVLIQINGIHSSPFQAEKSILTATPSQLCEALLRATGRWQQ